VLDNAVKKTIIL